MTQEPDGSGAPGAGHGRGRRAPARPHRRPRASPPANGRPARAAGRRKGPLRFRHKTSQCRGSAPGDSDTIRTPFRNPEKKLDANSPREGKRAVRGGDAPLQAHRGEDRPPHRAPFPRVLRKAHRRAQAQAGRGREAAPQASAQPDASAEAVLSLKSKITEDMKAAMRAKESARLSTIRLLLAAIKQREVDERIELDDGAVLGVIEKMIKQRRESIAQFEKAARNDLAGAEKAEIQVLSAYLPAQMSLSLIHI